MKFRLKALGIHLVASIGALTLILGCLYAGWYRWPGWYLADVPRVAAVMVGVDVVLGPLLTFVIANARKPRRELVRDVGIIVIVQLCALLYGATSLWNGRPLYYAFSVRVLQVIQAYDIPDAEAKLGEQKNPAFAPHWYTLPHWIWAPLPDDAKDGDRIMNSAISGGDDVTSMPRYFKPWGQGLPALREQLKKVDEIGYFSTRGRDTLKRKMRAAGLPIDLSNAMPMTGRAHPLLAVFDRTSVRILAIFSAD